MALSPLQPIRGRNLREYRKFRSEFHDVISEYSRKINDAKSENPNYSVENEDQIQEVYAKGLELVLVEATQEEKKFAPLPALVESVGVPLTDKAWELALIRHISARGEIPQNAEKIVGDIEDKTGLRYANEGTVRNNVALGVLADAEKNRLSDGSLVERIDYLANLISKDKFSEQVREKINLVAIASLKGAGFNQADRLCAYLPEGLVVPETYKPELHGQISRWGAQGRFDAIKSLEQRVPGIFSPERALNMGIELLGNLDTEKYDQLRSEFELEELDDDQKEIIRRKVISHLRDDIKKNPFVYEAVAGVNERVGTIITATPHELKDVVTNYFESWKRDDPGVVARALNQELDPSQIEDRYVSLLREKEHRKTSEANKLFGNTKIPISEERVEELIGLTRINERIGYVLNCQSLGHKLNEDTVNTLVQMAYGEEDEDSFRRITYFSQKPTREGLDEILRLSGKEAQRKVSWIAKFKKEFEFQPTEDTRNEIYRKLINDEPSYNSLRNLMIITDSVPPAEVVESIVGASFRRHDNGLGKTGWNSPHRSLDEVIGSLTKKDDISISDEQKSEVGDYISGRHDIDSIATGLGRSIHLYHFTPEFSEDEQRRMLSLADRGIAKKAYSNLKKNGADHYRTCQAVASVFGETVKGEASQRLGELVEEKNIYQAWIYAETTGAKPNLTTEQYDRLQSNFNAQKSRFHKGNQQYVTKVIGSWNPDQGDKE